METIATTIEDQALELRRSEETPPRNVRGPQRVFDVNFPGGGIAWKQVAMFEMVPHRDENLTVLSYRIRGHSTQSVVIDAVIVNEGGNAVRLSSPSGNQRYRLRLARSVSNEPIIVFSRDVVNAPGEDWSP